MRYSCMSYDFCGLRVAHGRTGRESQSGLGFSGGEGGMCDVQTIGILLCIVCTLYLYISTILNCKLGNHCSRCTVYTIIDCCVRACCIVTCIVPFPSCLATLHSSPCAALRPRSSLSTYIYIYFFLIYNRICNPIV